MTYQRYIRGDNHFIKFDDTTGWVLVGGPWFERLNNTPADLREIWVPSVEPLSAKYQDGIFDCFNTRKIVWRRVKIFIGGLLMSDESFIGYKWRRTILQKRFIRAWKVEDGIVPCFFDWLHWEEGHYPIRR